MFVESLKMSLRTIATKKMRSFLTMLGIIIGVIALVVLVSITSSATSSVTDSINSLGTNMLSVTISDDKDQPLKLDDITEMTSSLENIEAMSPVAQTTSTAYSTYSKNYADSDTQSATVYGTTSSYKDIAGLSVVSGRYFNVTDVDNHTNVVIISADMATDVMGTTDCLGQDLKLDGISYEIIGILEADSSSLTSVLSSSGDYTVYMPFTSLIRLSDSVSSEITSFVASAVDENDMDTAEAELTTEMLSRLSNDEDAFSVMNQSDIADTLSEVTNTLSLLLGGIAAISLLVGGIGIMNIMLVSVTERTREIGIRKAIGAGRSTILLQFLIEAIILSLLGCAIGILGSFLILKGIAIGMSASYITMSPKVVWIALAFSCAIGIVFGIYPANKASKKNPIEALRYIG